MREADTQCWLHTGRFGAFGERAIRPLAGEDHFNAIALNAPGLTTEPVMKAFVGDTQGQFFITRQLHIDATVPRPSRGDSSAFPPGAHHHEPTRRLTWWSRRNRTPPGVLRVNENRAVDAWRRDERRTSAWFGRFSVPDEIEPIFEAGSALECPRSPDRTHHVPIHMHRQVQHHVAIS